MRTEPYENSELETECLFGETLKVLDKHFDWYLCKLSTDNYIGWVQKKYLGKMLQATHRVVSKRTDLLPVVSGLQVALPAGAPPFR